MFVVVTETWVEGSLAKCHECSSSANEKESVIPSASSYSEFHCFLVGWLVKFLC